MPAFIDILQSKEATRQVSQISISQFAAPINAKRHFVTLHLPEYGDLPCVKTGKCIDCDHDLSICHYTVIIDGTSLPEKDRINVVLVGEEMGI